MNRNPRRSCYWRTPLFLGAALVLCACGVSGTPGTVRAKNVVTPTANVAQSSQCNSNTDFVAQTTSGDVSGCFRVPAAAGTSLVVSLQAYLDNYGVVPSGPTTTQATKPSGTLSISIASGSVRPGAHVDIVGRYASGTSITKSSYANLCWDGCQTGLVEQAVPLHWTGPRSFRTSLLVPPTAWIEVDHSGVIIHPLVSGTYDVGVQCVEQSSGCAMRAGDAQTTIQLKAPSPSRCVKGRTCVTLRLSTRHAAVGDEVTFSGWAPLQSIIGQPFGFNLSIAPSTSKHYAAFSSTGTPKGGSYNVDVAPTTLTVEPDRSWSSLGRLGYVSSTWSGPASLDPVSGSSKIAWCGPSGPLLANGATSVPVRTSGVAATFRGSGLTMLPGATSTPRCASIVADPRYHSSIFVGFDAAVARSIPPVYLAGLYTTNAGASWRWVPTPSGLTRQDFSDFTTVGSQVAAIFFDTNQGAGGSNGHWPLGSNRGLIEAELTTNGGVSWRQTTLSCPRRGPCVTFGPSLLGNCAMNGSSQSLMTGAPGSTTGASDVWHNSPWVSTVNNCFSQQLIATSAHGLLLLDPSSQYQVLQSSNSGRSWVNRSIPTVPGQTNPLPWGDVLLFTPSGDLLAMVPTPSLTRSRLFLLAPGATSWCQVPHVFDTVKGAWTVDSLRVDTHDLLWIQTLVTNSATAPSQLHRFVLSKITC